MNNENVKQSPFIYYDKDYKMSPFAYLDGRDNDDGVIIITKEDKKYVVGDRLYVEYKGTKIYAELDEAISIDTYNDSIFITRYDELSPPEDREYLLLLVYYDEDITDTFIGISGRQEVFDFIVNCADLINLEESKILAETTQMKDMWTVYKFTKMMINNEMVENKTGFDPDEFVALINVEE